MKQGVSAWSGAAVGIMAASLLCVLAYHAAHEQGWFGRSTATSVVRSQVYDSSVREQVYGEWKGESMNGYQSPSNQLDKLYTPTMQDGLSSE
ncbi:hypothetical protein [Paenibacillus xylaniclasticus]|uniref:hypothetical protein n=1 Tax=Paenibacillus xylaniclasticus TaxID=588083 RepID=UPI000FDB045D|nr:MULTISPECIES: hypothetical protein [Paenibacillus]GFN32061.1 hypothetical protein PCURB6_23210 [Paenibacillus curdlanolyticus]